jgi:hypothetical protein
LPLHVPVVAVSVLPTTALPPIVGNAVFAGAACVFVAAPVFVVVVVDDVCVVFVVFLAGADFVVVVVVFLAGADFVVVVVVVVVVVLVAPELVGLDE